MDEQIPACRAHWVRPRRAVLLAVLVGAVQAGAQTADAPEMPPPAAPAVFPIKGFQVSGDNPLGQGETARVLAPFLRSNATIDVLQKATAALEQALREQGFGLYRVALPPQEVGETVQLSIVKFTVGQVATEGRRLHDEANIRRSVPELREGATPNFRTLAIQTAIANENPNKQIQVGLREAAEPDRIDATITVREQRPWTFGIHLSNAGSDASGRDRLTLSGGHTNLFNRDHQFVGAYTTSMERPGDVRQLGLSYRVPLYTAGGVVGASYTRSDVVGNFGAFTSTGAGHTAGISYTLYLAPQGGRRSYVALGLEDKVFDATRINGILVPGQRDRRSRPLTLGYTARTESDAAVWGYHAQLAANTGTGRDNDLDAYRSEDPRISTDRWKALRGGGNYLSSVAGGWLLALRGQFQYSPDVLISGEQFGLGGPGSVRGTRLERPIAGDRGVSGTVELSTPELAAGLRLLGFVDAGWLGNNGPHNPARPASDRLVGAGVGLRFDRGAFGLSADYGRLLLGSRVPLAFNAAAPQRGDDRLYLNVSIRF